MKKKLLFLITATALLSFPIVNFAQAPNLRTTANFVLFTSAGAVTNSGISQFTGNVGTNSGSSTGFGNVNGVMHDNDGASGQAAADLLLLYSALNSAIPTFYPASPLLGNGTTLVPGVYYIPSVATLSGELILDAQNNANSVFIFQIQAAFSTNPASRIKLINGAQACNVFWKVEGLVSVATKTFMAGSIVANNAAINMNTSDTLQGRALSINGAVTTDGVLAYTPSGCGSAVLTGPAAPNLGASGCYAIFSGNGSVTNSGTTNLTGDVGTNVGLTTGFNPLLVNGMIHPIPDVSTAAAAAALGNAYTYLNTLPNDIELLYPAQFGSNLVLTPHTYIMNGAATFTDSLYLNAQGVPGAVFVIKIKGALSTTTYSKVLLINGALAANVYWVVDGAVDISDYSLFNGTIVCNNGAIKLATGISINGRALTTGGALTNTTSSVTAISPSGNCNTTLPVSWLYFRGKPVQNNVLLEWGTTNEMNNGFFTIEKSMDGQRFETLVTVSATKAVGTGEQNYTLTDKQPFAAGYYRISQTDKDGKNNVYKTILVKLSGNPGLGVRHYVVGNYIYVQVTSAKPGNGSIELFDIAGKKMASQRIIFTKETSLYKIMVPVQKGMYLINIAGQEGKLYTGKAMVL